MAAPATTSDALVPPAPASSTSGYHAAMLAGSVAVLALACLMTNDGDARVTVFGIVVPEICWWRRWLGWDCPGCGLTRSFVALAHGDLARAWEFKPVGVFLFAIVAAQIPYRLVQLWRTSQGQEPFYLRGARLVPWLIAGALAANCVWWAVKQFA